jgi:tellurite resistance protein
MTTPEAAMEASANCGVRSKRHFLKRAVSTPAFVSPVARQMQKELRARAINILRSGSSCSALAYQSPAEIFTREQSVTLQLLSLTRRGVEGGLRSAPQLGVFSTYA